jgi:hypothetical protein
MNDLRDDPDAIDPVAERTAFLRQWQQVPPGTPSWGRTTMHTPDGATWTNVDPPAPDAPDLRTVGEKVADIYAQLAEIMARLAAVEGYGEKAGYASGMAAQHEDRIRYLELMVHRLLNPGETEVGE